MHAVVKFYCLRGKTPTKMFEKLKSVYGNDYLSQTQMCTLHKEFSEGRETAELCTSQHSGQSPLSTKINVNIVRTLIEEDCSLTAEMEAIMDCLKLMMENIIKKTLYMGCCFNVRPALFNKTVTLIC